MRRSVLAMAASVCCCPALPAASLEQQVWNVVRVDLRTGVSQPLAAFTRPSGFVRFAMWDPATERVIFERAESTARIWSVALP